ncbi:MAG: hypothetical protein JNL82_21675 [Myxococcales bacterium]|nr:hypothetical protein [Myxococcales bacterium]
MARLALWLPIVGAPLGLLFAILVSLAISGWKVTHSAIVQVERVWRPGESLALRVHVLDGAGEGIPGATVTARAVRGEQSVELGELRDATGGGATQGRFTAPAWPAGPAALALTLTTPTMTFAETVDVTLAERRDEIRGTLTISTSVKNWADDTEPQPERVRIALRPLGRLSAGFDNVMLVRVTDPDGKPHVGPIKVRLLDGEWGAHRGGDTPPVVAEGPTDAQGLLRFEGALATDVVRFEVEVAAPPSPVPAVMSEEAGKKSVKPGETAKEPQAVAAAAPVEPVAPAPLGSRRFRLVSFAGAVKVTAEPLAVAAGQPLAIHARGLRARKPVYIDVHGVDGAWIDTLAPVLQSEPPREWSTATLRPGFVQIEAYQFTTSPGESAALARVQVTEGAPDGDASLAPLIAQQRRLLEVGRVEKGFDRTLEAAWLDAVEKAEVAAADVPLARAWLLGTLPIEVLGPPPALSTAVREQDDLVARKRAWALGLKWFLLGGGGLFLALTLVVVVVSHRRAAGALTREILGDGATAEIAQEIARAQRAVLLRAVALVVTMALGLVLTVVVLDKLLWQV